MSTRSARSTRERRSAAAAREFPLDEAGRARFRSRWRELFEGDPSKKSLYRDVSNGVPAAGIEYYLPLFFEAAATLFDYLPQGCSVALHHDVPSAIQDFWCEATLALQAAGRRPQTGRWLPPPQLFVPAEEFYLRLARAPAHRFPRQGGGRGRWRRGRAAFAEPRRGPPRAGSACRA